MPDEKTITRMALSTAMMAGFSLNGSHSPKPGGTVPAPGAAGRITPTNWGGRLAALISGIQFFVELLWPETEKVPQKYLPLNGQSLENEMTRLNTDIETIVKNAAINLAADKAVARSKAFHQNVTRMLSFKVDGDAFQFVKDTSQTDYVEELNRYFDLTANDGVLNLCFTDLNTISMSVGSGANMTIEEVAKFQSKTFGLYLLLGSLIVSYLKYALVWRWGNRVLGSLQWDAWSDKMASWQQLSDSVRKSHPPPVKPRKSAPLPLWQDWRAQAGCPVNRLIDEVNTLVALCVGTPAQEGLYTAISNRWQGRVDKINQRLDQITIATLNFGPLNLYQVVDSKTGWKSHVSDSYRAAALCEVMAGTAIAYEWNHWTDAYALANVTEQALKDFADCIELWKQNRDSVNYKAYTVVGNESGFAEVAYLAYGFTVAQGFRDRKTVESFKAIYGNNIHDFNRDDLIDPVNLVAGQVLKIPDVDFQQFRTGPNGAVDWPFEVATNLSPSLNRLQFVNQTVYAATLDIVSMVDFTLPVDPASLVPDILQGSDLFASLLWGKDERVPLRHLPFAAAGLTAEAAQLQSEAAWFDTTGSGDVQTQIKALYIELHQNWSAMLSLKIDKQTADFTTDVSTAVDGLNHYFDDASKAGKALQLLVRALLPKSANDPNFDLFILASTLTIAYMRLAVAWRWGLKIRSSLRWEANAAARAERAAAPQASSNAHLKQKMMKPEGADPLPAWQDWIKDKTCPVNAVISIVSQLAAACEGTPAQTQGLRTYDYVIGRWKQLAENLMFNTYQVQPGDLMLNIILKFYNIKDFPDAIWQNHEGLTQAGLKFLMRKIIAANPGNLKTEADLAPGQVLVIPHVAPQTVTATT